MRFTLDARASGTPERAPMAQTHPVLRLRRGACEQRGRIMSASDDVMGAALVLVRAAQAPTQQVEYFSQRNCDLLGLTKRGFLELLRRPDAPRSVRLGKSRLVRRVDMIEFLERLSLARSEQLPARDGADQVLSELGCVVPRRRHGA